MKQLCTCKTVGDVDLVAMRLAQKNAEGTFLCVLSYTVVVVNHREQDKRVNSD